MIRKIIWLLAAFMLSALPMETDAQGFLKKLKQKAEKAVNKVVGVEDEAEYEDRYDSNEEQQETQGKPTATDRIPKLRQVSFVWDEQVVPSKASTVEQLMKELPALPSVEQLANPDDAERKAYYNRLSAVSMRVDELDEEWACSDEEMLALRDQLYNEIADAYGLTAEDLKRLDDPNCPQAEKERIEEKIKQSMLGGLTEERIANMVPEDFESKSEKYSARLEEIGKEMEVYEKKEKKGTMTNADRARMAELNKEALAIQQDMMSGVDMETFNSLANLGKKEQALANKMNARTARMEQRLKAYSDKVAALQKTEEGVVNSCEEIAKEYEEELKDIYERIYRLNDVDSIHALYDRADNMMKNYRTRAAKIWLRSLSTRLENTKKLLPEAIAVYADMAEEGLIPECATRRASLNVVVNCEDILHDAYDDFPKPTVLPYHMEAMNILKENERIMYAECGFLGGFGNGGGVSLFDAFSSGSRILIYNDKEEAYYKLENGTRTKLVGDGPFNFFKKGEKTDYGYGDIPLRKGERVATFSTGRVLILHDGTYVVPVAMRRYSNRLEFIVHDVVNDKEDFYKCTYKL